MKAMQLLDILAGGAIAIGVFSIGAYFSDSQLHLFTPVALAFAVAWFVYFMTRAWFWNDTQAEISFPWGRSHE